MEKVGLSYSHSDTVATLTLNDGKGNVLDHIMMNDLLEVIPLLRDNPQLKLIIIQGAGKHFSFGASVAEHTRDLAPAMLRALHQLILDMIHSGVPTMAKITGQCLGGGMELALTCNFLFADSTARMGQPEIVLGVFPPPASILLPLKIGNARAEDLVITGRTIDADEAYRMGLLNGVFEDRATLDEGIDEWIKQHIIPRSASSLRYAVRASRIKFAYVVGNFLQQLEKIYVTQLMDTHDANEGITAFLEKREPIWHDN